METVLRLRNARVRATINKIPAARADQDDLLEIKFGFCEEIKEELKIMAEGGRWKPESKAWTFKDSQRTAFVLALLQGQNPYAPYDAIIPEYVPSRECLYHHQRVGAGHMIHRRQCITAAEMGTGKTLMAIEAIEHVGEQDIWYVAPRGALYSVMLDFDKWKAKIIPKFMTYEKLVKTIETWTPGANPPFGVFFDEGSRLKNHESKRSKCAKHLADNIRKYTNGKGLVSVMSGSPAPKSPLDWWMLAEIACPGFIREGNIHRFRDRVAIVKMEESLVSAAKYPKIITFKDDVNKCNICGKFQSHDIHLVTDDAAFDALTGGENENHAFVPMTNEVHNLSTRMKGLTYAILKKDCLDLPEKVYTQRECTPTKYTLSLAKMIVKTARSAAQALINLRELSDGFQYYEKEVGTIDCEKCGGTGESLIEGAKNKCIYCSGKGKIKQFETATIEVPTPKDEALQDILELKEEDGRLIVYAGFTGTIDKICRLVTAAGWTFIRVDGRGWMSSLAKNPMEMLQIFQNTNDERKIAFVAHPKSAGMGLTLTASDTTLYYSNDFDGESRVQSEDRNHRIGTRGCNIIDLFHLPVDKLVYNNLKTKRKLELMTLGELNDCLPEIIA